MKGTYISIVLVLLIFVAIVVGYFVFHVKDPVDVVQDFYSQWINKNNNYLVGGGYEKLAVLSDAYKQRLEADLGTTTPITLNTFDPVVCSQGKPDSFTVSLLSKTDTDAHVLVIEKFGAQEVPVRVDVVSNINSWQIYSVLCGSGDTVEAQNKVADYLRDFISKLSPTKAVLGGTFFVTKILFNDGNGGTVDYEDGHIAFHAAFTYSLDALGRVHIESFKIIQEGTNGKG